MTSVSRRITSLARYGFAVNHVAKLQTFNSLKPGYINGIKNNDAIFGQTQRMMSSEATSSPQQVTPPSYGYTRRRKRGGRFKKRLIFWGILFGAWIYFVDADFITYFSDKYRILYKKEENCFAYKNLWIVGASSGIGEYLVYEAAKNQAKKIIISARRENELERVKKTCNSRYPECEVVVQPLDVLDFLSNPTDHSENDKYMEEMLTTHGDIDVLILNTGLTQASNAVDTDMDVLQNLINVNVFSMAAMATSMIRSWKSLNYINDNLKSIKNKKIHSIAVTSSLSGKMGSPQRSGYSLTKHGLNGYFESLRSELFEDNVNVNIICPGPVQTTAESRLTVGATTGSSKSRGQGAPDASNNMSTQRSAQLYCTAIRYNIEESWQSTHPVLFFAYLRQYMSAFIGPLTKLIAPMYSQEK